MPLSPRHYTTYTFSAPELSRQEELKQHPGGEMLRVIAQLEKQVAELQKVCDERLRVIEEIHQAAEKRLALIQNLDAECREREEIIKMLQVQVARVKNASLST